MKIPTILGLALLITSLVLGIMVYSYNKQITDEIKILSYPKNIKIVNVTDTQATIVWQTDTKVSGKVIYGINNYLKQTALDDRDQSEKKAHFSHFTTLKNLNPSTIYNFKLASGKFTLPEIAQEFKTAPKSEKSKTETFTNISPLRGIILDTDLNPVDDSLVFLKIKDAAEIATFSSSSGNFIMPLVNLRTEDLNSLYKITGETDTNITIIKGPLESKIQMQLPFENQILPPLTLGQNININDYLNSNLAKQNTIITRNQFDINNDGIVNSLDLSILTQSINKKIKDPKLDFNKDDLLNQQDVNILKSALQ